MVRFLEYLEPCPIPVHIRSIAVFQNKVVEQAGRAYHERVHGKRQAPVRRIVSTKPGGVKPKLKMNVDLKDFYGLLHLPVTATTDEIRRSYREVSLLYHPDKNPDAEHIYKAIQEAQTTLTDSRRRRVYDSTLPFDESIPSEVSSISDDAFYATFGPVFRRNAWFSVVQPTPLLGHKDTPFAEVDAFYDFWFGFRSWRDFSADCEHKPELAENREERRWMEKENQKVTNAKVKAEAARIRKIVDRAFKVDPRIKTQRALEKAERLARKKEKAALRSGAVNNHRQDDVAKHKQKETRLAAEAAAAAQQAERLNAKKAAQDEKRMCRTLRKCIRETIMERFNETFERHGWQIDDLFAGLAIADLQEFAATMKGDDQETALAHINQHIDRVYK